MHKKAQQEIVGFVLIVVVVMVGLMIYLTISLRNSPENEDNVEVANILDALMKQITECAIVYEPDYDNFEDLFKSSYKGDTCSNLNIPAIEYLESSLTEVLKDIMATESSIMSYELNFRERDSDGYSSPAEGFPRIIENKDNCTGTINSAMRTLSVSSMRLDVTLKTCTF